MEAIENAKCTIAELEARRYRAMVEADVKTLTEMFAGELSYSHSDGGRDTKTSLLEKVTSGYLDYLDVENPDQEVVVVGQTAIVTGRMVARLQVGGAPKQLNNRSLSVWTWLDDRWLFLAYQPTVLHDL